ncbi:ATP-dependent DNA helicase [Thermodesulfobacteriota bacterium]
MNDPIIKDYFSEGGTLDKSLPFYEYRHEQLVMAEHVYDTFLKKGILIAEAKTGTGKTLAYLIPAVLSRKKTVISTGTKNLQEQIFKKDIPFLKETLGMHFDAACMKGRANYICLKKLKIFKKQGSFEFEEDVKHFNKVLAWISETATGDIEELTDIPENSPFFRQITSTSEQCTGQKCPNVKECFITRMKEHSLKADIIIINHHLFFADLVVKENSDQFVIVPHYKALVFDEAHQIEDTASSYFGVVMSSYRFEELVRDTKFFMSTNTMVDAILNDILDRLTRDATKLFNIFSKFTRSGGSTYKLAKIMSTKEESIEKSRTKLFDSIDLFVAHLETIKKLPEDLNNCLRRAEATKAELFFVTDMSDLNYVYYCETRGKGTFLKASPIDVSSTLKSALFEKQDTIVMTSATLATDNCFTYIKERVGLTGKIGGNPSADSNIPEENGIEYVYEDINEHNVGASVPGFRDVTNPVGSQALPGGLSETLIEELILESPFDYESRALYYLPLIKNDPSSEKFADEAAEKILKLIQVTGGRTFALFTSIRNMRKVYELISAKIEQNTFMQGDMPKSALLKEFISDKTSVLFATMSFWGGVDVQGDSLVSVIIDKLPFSSPYEPLNESKINLIKQKGGNPFFDFQVPQAIITLKQGLGRLIRKKDDYGILTILDRRLRSKGYGRKFIDSIPKAKTTREINDVEKFLKQFTSEDKE